MLADFVKETTTTTGTVASLTLSAVTGFARFADAFPVGSPVIYAIQSGNNRETGVGTVGASNTLTRVRATAKYESGVLTKNPATFMSLAGTSDVMIALSSAATETGQSMLLRANSSVAKHVMSAGAPYTTKGNAILAPNYLYVFPYRLEMSGTVGKIGCLTNVGRASSTCRVGLYAQAADGSLGQLLMESGVLDTIVDNTVYLGTITNTHLQAGWYWAVIQTGATAPDCITQSLGNGYLALSGLTGTRHSVGINYAARTMAALPSDGSTLPSLTAELLGNMPYNPLVILEML